MKSISLAVAVLVAASGAFAEPIPAPQATTTSKGVEEASAMPTLNAQVVQGCFSSSGSLVMNSTQTYNSKSKCAHDICFAMGYQVAGTTGGNVCYCGNKYPPQDALASDSKCNAPCSGFDYQACGGIGYWTIYNTGISLEVDSDDDSVLSSSSSSSRSTSAPTTSATGSAVVTVSGSVVVITQTSTPTETSSSKKSGGSTNTAGIAAGAVVAVVAVLGIVGGIFFFMRRRRNHEIEEEHRRNAAVNAFMHGSKPPSSSGGISMTDSRLDPVLAHRRMSDGSIADNQDYSRKILRVTNA